jgi:hypothetical protein
MKSKEMRLFTTVVKGFLLKDFDRLRAALFNIEVSLKAAPTRGTA